MGQGRAAEAAITPHETRSYELTYVNALWRYDFHEGKRQLVTRAPAGPGQTLSSLAMAQPRGAATMQRLVVSSARHAYDPQADVAVLLKALSQLRLAGARLETDRFQPPRLGDTASLASEGRRSQTCATRAPTS